MKRTFLKQQTYVPILDNNQVLVHFDKNDNLWKLGKHNANDVQTKKQTMVHIATTPGKGMTLEELDRILKQDIELIPEEYDGCYEWISEAIKEYAKPENKANITVDDMNFLYSLAVGTWKMSINVKKDRLANSNLCKKSRDHLTEIIDSVWNRALTQKHYFHHTRHSGGDGSPQVGMFGTGFMTFSGKLSDKDAKSFIKMCTDIVDLNDDNKIYDICSNTLNSDYEGKGLKSASASAILHCFKPYVFPIINNNDGHGTIYELFKVDIKNIKALSEYINNCKKIKEFRDSNYTFKNYRILDVAIWAIDNKDFDLDSYVKMKKV